MTEDRSGRDLVPRPEEPTSAVTPREPAVPAPSTQAGERFYAGDQAHTVGLTEERAAKIVKQSGNARMVGFLAALFFVLFIPLYWLYDIGIHVVGFDGRLTEEQTEQQVTDISRGYALFLANCARCHGETGQGGIGPPLNDQGKLYNVVIANGAPGPGHLNPSYLLSVLTEGGRYVCGDPNSVMPAWLDPKGPLNYRQVNEIIAWITASKDISFVYQPVSEGGAAASLAPPETVTGWRDPSYTPPPDATPVPDCWRGTPGGGSTTPSAAPVTSPGTADNPRIIQVEGNPSAQWVDPATGQPLTSVAVVPGEVIQFQVKVDNLAHNFHIGAADELSAAPEHNDLPGIDTFTGDTKTFTYTVDNLPAQPQFACTVLGHYPSMHVDLVVQQPGGSAAPGASAAPGSSAGPSAPPASAAVASPAPSAAP